jgi:hypothetical protein
VDTAGDTLTSCHISSSAECIVFGGSGGYMHLWAASDEPKVGERLRLRLARPPRPPASLPQ